MDSGTAQENLGSRQNFMIALMRVVGFPFSIGGETHSGWLPPGAAVPLVTPIRHVLLDLEIQYDDSGYLLLHDSPDGSICGDTWHQSLEDAQQAAMRTFGVQQSDWKMM